MGISSAHERRRVDQLDAGDVLDSDLGQGSDLVAGAGGDAEDAGVVVEVGEGFEGEEEGGEGLDGFEPFVGGPEAVVFLGEGGARAVGVVAGGFWVWAVCVGASEVGEGYAGLWGLEEEGEEGECGDGD